MKIISCDGQDFDIDQDTIKQSKLLKYYFEEDLNEPITLPHIPGSIMEAVIDFCNHHKNDPQQEINYDDSDDDDDENENSSKPTSKSQTKQKTVISEWDRQFVQKFTVREQKLFDIITAANYLGIESLLHVLCRSFITMIRGKSSEQIVELFKLVDNLEETSMLPPSSLESKKN